MAPEHEPIDCIITFSPRAFFLLNELESPTAIMAMGIAASKTWPTLRPKKAAAAEKMIVMTSPHETDHAFTSGYVLSGESRGL